MTTSVRTPATVTRVFLLVLVNNREVVAVANSVIEAAVKVPVHTAPPKTVPWTASREAASLWSGDIDGKRLYLYLTVIFSRVSVKFKILSSHFVLSLHNCFEDKESTVKIPHSQLNLPFFPLGNK